MAKRNDEASGCLIMLAIIAWPFVWLYEKVGAVWFWVIMLLIVVGLLVWIFSDKNTNESTSNQQLSIYEQPDFNTFNDAWWQHCEKITDAWETGNYDWARRELQKVAYGLVGKSVPKDIKDEFTRLMTEFASEDPLYKQVMAKILPMVQANPGMMQSAIYKGQSEEIKEQMRYVLYFAHELGHIHRIKKGNSYKLMPAGEIVDIE